MPKSKARRSKNKIKSRPLLPSSNAPWWKWRWKSVVGIAGTVAAIVGFASALGTFLPRMTLEPSGPIDLSNPSPIAFVITNTSIIPLDDVRPMLGICEVGFVLTENSPARRDSCSGSLKSRLAPVAWATLRIDPDQKHMIAIEDSLGSRRIGYADISIIVAYRPWFLPWRREKEFRFETRKMSDGKLYWFPRPVI